MTDKDLNSKWAWSQIEAYADGTLRGAALERMRAALRQDPELRAAAGRAAAVRHALTRTRLPALPTGLRWRLLGIPARAGHSWRWPALRVAVAAASLILVVVLLREASEAPPDPRSAAIRDFEVAMTYLHRSLERSNEEVRSALGAALHDAVVASRAPFDERTSNNRNGDRQ